MQMTQSPFVATHLRVSLKRGLARQAVDQAEAQAADMARLVTLAREFRPNPKAMARLAARLRVLKGVLRVTAEGASLTVTARLVREVQMQVEGATLFQETGLIYHRLRISLVGGMLTVLPSAVSFSRHALERLVERSDLALDRPILPEVDLAARRILRAWDAGALITEGGDLFAPAPRSGLWAGGIDEMDLEADWGLASRAMSLQVFSARTFLSETEMRPTLWLRWRDDPACRLG